MAQKQKSGKKSKAGRNKDKTARYYGRQARWKNKLKRVFHSQGWHAAQAYAALHTLQVYLREHVYPDSNSGLPRWGKRKEAA